ncbi:hypothetical protein Tco_1430598 [Tanacetum coccineum]
MGGSAVCNLQLGSSDVTHAETRMMFTLDVPEDSYADHLNTVITDEFLSSSSTHRLGVLLSLHEGNWRSICSKGHNYTKNTPSPFDFAWISTSYTFTASLNFRVTQLDVSEINRQKVGIDFEKEPIGTTKDGKEVFFMLALFLTDL